MDRQNQRYNLLDEIDTKKDDWNIRVRVTRMWEVLFFFWTTNVEGQDTNVVQLLLKCYDFFIKKLDNAIHLNYWYYFLFGILNFVFNYFNYWIVGTRDRGGSWRVSTLARGLRRKSKGRSIDVVILQATSLKGEATRGGEEMNPNILWYSKWKLESKESGSQ